MLKKRKTEQHRSIGKRILLLLLVGTCCAFTACRGQSSESSTADEVQTSTVSSADEAQVGKNTGKVQDEKPNVPEQIASSADLYCEEFTVFSGVFVENGKNEEVEDVAAILVENRSDAFLDRANISYKYGDEKALFVVTGLPAGEKCWVLEKNKMKVDGKHKFEFNNCTTAFNSNAIEVSEHLTTETNDNVVKVTNTSRHTLENVCVYYKNTFDDGNYFGGITYVLAFGELGPGESMEKESAHFSDKSAIVKFSYQV